MKTKIIFLLIITIFSFSCQSEKKEEAIFTISGNLMNYEKESIVLQTRNANTYKTILTAKNKNANFYKLLYVV